MWGIFDAGAFADPNDSVICADGMMEQDRRNARAIFVCSGEVREWLNRAVSKTVEPERVPWVRIPPSPPESFSEIGFTASQPHNLSKALSDSLVQ